MGKGAQAKAQRAAAMQAVDPKAKVASLEDLINYTFTNHALAWEALQLPGNGFDTSSTQDGNKRLAIIGDTVIDLVLGFGWYSSGQDKGTWTAIRDAKASNKNLAVVGRDFGLKNCIQNSLTNKQHISPQMLATAVEAVVGAVYLDCRNLEVVEMLLKKMKIL